MCSTIVPRGPARPKIRSTYSGKYGRKLIRCLKLPSILVVLHTSTILGSGVKAHSYILPQCGRQGFGIPHERRTADTGELTQNTRDNLQIAFELSHAKP